MIDQLVKPFSYYKKRSLMFHVGAVIVMAGLSYFQWAQGEKQRNLNIKLVQSSVRVDVVALPEKTFQELKALQESGQTSKGAPPKAEPEVKAPEPETPDTGNEFIKKKEKSSFADLMKQYSQKKVEEKRPTKKKKKEGDSGLDSQSLAQLNSLIKKGNKVSAGQALVGSGNAETLTQLQEYAAKLPALVKPYWKLPSYLLDKGHQCRIQVFINGRGELVKANIYEKSKDPEYDSRALKAVRAAAPFPPPEDDIRGRALRGDILLGFPL